MLSLLVPPTHYGNDCPGVGPETADAILLYALDHPVPVADEYLRRVAERHHLLTPALRHDRKSYDSLVDLTRQAFANDPSASHAILFNEFHALTVAIGKAHCGRTPGCQGCPLAEDLQWVNSAIPQALPRTTPTKTDSPDRASGTPRY
ncbi:MAG: hypothetical protein WBQ94_07135 [Terracidiphilus sp.]